MAEISDIMRKYHGYMCGWGKKQEVDRIYELPGNTTMNATEKVDCVQYTPCFLPGLMVEEEAVLRSHIEALFSKEGVTVIQPKKPLDDNITQLLERSRRLRERTYQLLKKPYLGGNTEVVFLIESASSDAVFKIIDDMHGNLSCPEREYVVDNVRNIVIMKAQPT